MTKYSVKDHILVSNCEPLVSQKKTANKRGIIKPKFIIIHYTAATTAGSTINWFTSPENKNSSSHLLIAQDGLVTQFAPFNIATWHAGESSWKGYNGLNQYSIGIELVNGGPLIKQGDKYIAADRKEVKDFKIINGQAWQSYTLKQMNELHDICEELKKEYNIADIIGHDEISPKRKIDPGHAFPWEFFKDLKP